MKLFKKKETPVEHKMISVVMPDGTVEEYADTFQITDGINVAVCGKTYHTHFDCPVFQMDRKLPMNLPIRGMYRVDAQAQCINDCYKCREYDELEKEWK